MAIFHLAYFRRPDFLLELCRRREVLATFLVDLAAEAFPAAGASPEEAFRLALDSPVEVEADFPAEVPHNKEGVGLMSHN